jgi:hypothetical protein
VGFVLVLTSFLLRSSSWASGLLIEVGVTLTLFIPLVWVEQQLERRIDTVEKRQSDLVKGLRQSVHESVRRVVDETLQQRQTLNQQRKAWAAARRAGTASATVLPADFGSDGQCGAVTRDGGRCRDRVASHGLCNNHLSLVRAGRVVLWHSSGLGIELA